jgi:hypothetical protein
MFGGGGSSKPIAQQQPTIHALRIQTSVYGQVIPIVYGTARIAPRLIWYGDFRAIAHTSTQKVGGKGGGGGKTTTTTQYTYQAAVEMALCEGQIEGVASVWDTKGNRKTNKTAQSAVIPTTPFQVQATGVFIADLGVTQVVAYSFTAFDYGDDLYGVGRGRSGNETITFVKVASSPAAGQYSVTAGGLYTFNTADVGKTVTLNFIGVNTGTSTPLANLGFSIFTGARPQTAWGYLTSNHAGQDLGYSGVALAANSAQDLGDSGELGNYNFEIVSLKRYAGTLDANPADILTDLLTSAEHGIGFPSAFLDALVSWSNYCRAAGILISPVYDAQRSAAEIIDELCLITNSAAVWSEGKLKILPYGDTSLRGNGVTYVPATAPQYDLTTDDFLAGDDEDPIQIECPDIADAFNVIKVEFLNRSNDYNPEPVEERDSAHIETYGERPKEPYRFHAICDKDTAALVGNTLLKRELYIRTKYHFKLPFQYCLLEPMDLVTLTDVQLGLDKTPVRIISITENEDRSFEIEAEEFPFAAATSTLYPKQAPTSYTPQFNADPLNATMPIALPCPARFRLDQSAPCVYMFGAAGGQDWGGCTVWLSVDGGVNYKAIGQITSPMRAGLLTANLSAYRDPDYTGTLSVDLTASAGSLLTASQAMADNLRTLCYLYDTNGSTDEFLTYEVSALITQYNYNLTKMRRGLFGRTAALRNTSTTRFYRIDDAITQISLDPSLIGKLINFKFTSFNKFGRNEQSLADVSDVYVGIAVSSAPNVYDSGDFSYQLTSKFTASGSANSYATKIVNTGGYTIVSGDELHYDVWFDPNSVIFRGGVDFISTVGTNLRTSNPNDQNGLAAHPQSPDLSSYAKGQWYHRKFSLTAMAGGVIGECALVVSANNAGGGVGVVTGGMVRMRVRNAYIWNGSTLKATVIAAGAAGNGATLYSGTATTLYGVDSQIDTSLPTILEVIKEFEGAVDLSSDGTTSKGILPPAFSGGFTYTSTGTQIVISWANIAIQRNYKTISIKDGSVTITGLGASTTYYFYPYYDETTGTLRFLIGGSPAGTGTSSFGAIAHTSKSDYNASAWAYKSNVPLSSAPLAFATTAGAGGGGSGGGSGTCLRARNTWVISRTRGIVLLKTCSLGEQIKGRNGLWVTITRLQILPHELFLSFDYEHGGHLDMTPYHLCTVLDPDTDEEIEVKASRTHSEHAWLTATGVSFERKRETIIDPDGEKVSVTCEPEKLFLAFSGDIEDFTESKMTVTHNMQPSGS